MLIAHRRTASRCSLSPSGVLTTPTAAWTLVGHRRRPDGDLDVIVRRTPHGDRGGNRYFGYRLNAVDATWRQVGSFWTRPDRAAAAIECAPAFVEVGSPHLLSLLCLVTPRVSECSTGHGEPSPAGNARSLRGGWVSSAASRVLVVEEITAEHRRLDSDLYLHPRPTHALCERDAFGTLVKVWATNRNPRADLSRAGLALASEHGLTYRRTQ
ncbi:hypothetical protein GCM10010466_39520 [Planomonospora alba]|uniref:Uncharacterized protein n=1 Tax=Planomonospora alba TaxID=161354 RepID=A0ABP6NDB5_9ACTN